MHGLRPRGRHVAAGAAILTLALAAGPAAGQTPDACHDPSDPAYASHACKVTRLRERPWVVIATVDTGINPYHQDFRLPADDDLQGVHPSEFIDGYPASTRALELSLDEPNLNAALSTDAAKWSSIKPRELMWIPGTAFIGGIEVSPVSGDFFDTAGHGTGVASIAGGRLYGQGGPNVLLVGVTGSGDGWGWAASQPWIDLISISWSALIPVLDTSAEASRAAVQSGKINCVATGNLTIPIWFWEAQGPSWNVNVGAVNGSRQLHDYSGSPADVVAFPDLKVASNTSTTETYTFGGTSGATPHTCALLAKVISAARARLGDTAQGPHGGGLVVGAPGSGALADGVLKRREIEDAVQSTAAQLTGTAPWIRAGYGIVEDATIDDALAVLFGEKPRPPRPDEDLWIQTTDALRNAAYGNPPD